ncbi:MAG: hypothetical protein COX70_08120, partial [Flavobacteriales bacterium CG_4_10_14_0_2_um_filter_32_8]
NTISEWKGYVSNGNFVFKAAKIEKELKITIYNLLGEIIQTSVVYHQKEFNINMNDVKQGIYFVNVISDSKQECFKVVNY